MMESFWKIVSGFPPLIVFAKIFVLDIWQDSEHASDFQLHVNYEAASICFTGASILQIFPGGSNKSF